MRGQGHDRHAAHGVPGQHDVARVGRLEHRLQVVREGVDGQGSGAARARTVAPLVVEDDPVALFPEPSGDGNPDLVAAAPTVGQHDRRGFGPVALDVPHRQSCTVGCADDPVVGPDDAVAPAQRPPAVVRAPARSRRTVARQTPVGRSGRGAGGEGPPEQEEAAGAGTSTAGFDPAPGWGSGVMVQERSDRERTKPAPAASLWHGSLLPRAPCPARPRRPRPARRARHGHGRRGVTGCPMRPPPPLLSRSAHVAYGGCPAADVSPHASPCRTAPLRPDSS